MTEKNLYYTNIWREEAESDNPFAAKECFCHGYNVFGDLLGKISLVEYIYLLFKGEKTSKENLKSLEDFSVAISNPGIREPSVMSAMNSGVGGSPSAAALISALATGAGQLGGAREVFMVMNAIRQLGESFDKWKDFHDNPPQKTQASIWPDIEHFIGFEPNGVSTPKPLKQLFKHLVKNDNLKQTKWLNDNYKKMEKMIGYPVSITSIAAALFHDLGFSPDEGEALFLILRLPGAAVHALEQKKNGMAKFPFYGDAVTLKDDPGFKGFPEIPDYNYDTGDK